MHACESVCAGVILTLLHASDARAVLQLALDVWGESGRANYGCVHAGERSSVDDRPSAGEIHRYWRHDD